MSNRTVILGASGAFVALLTLGPVWAFPLADRGPEEEPAIGPEDDDALPDVTVPEVTVPEVTVPEVTVPESSVPARGDDRSVQPASAQAEVDAALASLALVGPDGSLADTAEAMVALDLIAGLTLGDETLTVALIGHTDSTGEATANLLASQRLAESARRRLIERGVPGERVFSFGQGEAQPVAANDTEEGRARNRRLEVIFGVWDL